VHRFFFIDNGSTDGTRDYLQAQSDCHVFDCGGRFFAENVEPPLWSNALRNVYGDGHWCLSLDADEMFVFPHCEDLSITDLCHYLEREGSNALLSLVIDMYGAEEVLSSSYKRGERFLDACPYFDPDLGDEIEVEGGCPPVLTFSKFRKRAFWSKQDRAQRPPCITQVPLVKWSKETNYLVAQHSLNSGRLSALQAGVLHFKFFPGFYESIAASLEQNATVAEKGLQERKTYLDTLERNPTLTLLHDRSERYKNSRQLVELGWMRTSSAYEEFAEGRRHLPRRRIS